MNENLSKLAADQKAKLAEQEEAGRNLAVSLLESDGDWMAVAEALRGHVPMALWLGFADALELCAEHGIDAAICRDDEDPSCDEGQMAAEQRQLTERIAVVRELHGDEAAELMVDGWTMEAAVAHVEGSCDVELCGAPSHRACAWFAMCENQASRFVAHPVLGWVPSCERCQTVVGR